MGDPVLTIDDGPVRTLVLDRPERRNPLSMETIGALGAELDAISRDPSVRVVIIAANGPVFSAGHDLREMLDCDDAFAAELFRACGELMLKIHDLPQPVIAQVEGVATAAGCQLVAACDLAVAADTATFATPGVRIGLFCTTPMVEVVRAVGRKRAMHMLLTGEPIDAATALDWGLVNDVVPAGAVASTARRLAERIASASSTVVATGKRAFYENVGLGLRDAYDHAGPVMADASLDPDAQEGFAAFLEKRPPVWRDRPAAPSRGGTP